MIHALLPNRLRSLYRTSVKRNPISKSDDIVTSDRQPQSKEIEKAAGVRISGLFDVPTDSPSQITSTPSIPETIKATVADLQSLPRYPTMYSSRACYHIHTRETLLRLPKGSVFKSTLQSDADLSLRSSVESFRSLKDAVPINRNKDLSRYRQVVSLHQSRRDEMVCPREFTDNTVFRPHEFGLKVFILGIPDSGKTTLQKSMRIAFEAADEQWRVSYKPDVDVKLESEDHVSFMDCTKQ